MIGLDSCSVIDLFRGNESLKKVIENIDDNLVLNNMCFLELMFGIDFDSQKGKKEESFYDSLFSSLDSFELDNSSCKKASQIMQELMSKGEAIEQFDCVIAAIYLNNEVNSIITRNEKHFSKVKGLKVISY